MRTCCLVLVTVSWVTACKPEPAPPPPTVPDAGCPWGEVSQAVVSLGKRAATGDSIVSPEGCSLFDGKLLARGFPTTTAEAREKLSFGPGCVPTLNSGGSRLTLGQEGAGWTVTQVRNLNDETMLEKDKEAGLSLQTELIKAARCPRPDLRLKSDDDAGASVAYALATEALQRLLAGEPAEKAVPQDTRDVLDKVCKEAEKLTPVSSGTAEEQGLLGTLQAAVKDRAQVAPLAAMALVMAGSLTVFGEAANRMELRDEQLERIKPFARGVLGHAPRTNLQGVCSTWSMVTGAAAPPPVKAAVRKSRKK